MSTKQTVEWVAVAVVIVVVGIAAWNLDLNDAPVPARDSEQVEVLDWNWKKDRSGRILAIFGNVRNNTETAFDEVVLELRTEDAEKKVLARHPIVVGKLGPNATRPFREDVPRTGDEAMGYVETKTLR